MLGFWNVGLHINTCCTYYLWKLKHILLWQTYWKRIEMDKNLYFLESWEKYKIISNEIQVLCKIRIFYKVRLNSLRNMFLFWRYYTTTGGPGISTHFIDRTWFTFLPLDASIKGHIGSLFYFSWRKNNPKFGSRAQILNNYYQYYQ